MRGKIFSLRLLFVLLLAVSSFKVFSQNTTVELLKKWESARLEKGYHADTSSVILLNKLSFSYLYNHTDSALYFAKEALRLAEIEKFQVGEALSLVSIAKTYYVMGNYPLSLDASDRLMHLSEKINYTEGKASAYLNAGLIYLAQNNNGEAIIEFKKSLVAFVRPKDDSKIATAYFDIGLCYDESGNSQKAFSYMDTSMAIAKELKNQNLISMIIDRRGEIYFHLKKYKTALKFYQQVTNSRINDNWELDFAYSGIAQSYEMLGNYEKAILNAKKSLVLCEKVNSQFDAIRAITILTESYQAIKDYRQAYQFEALLKRSNDSIFNSEKEKEINYLHLKQQQTENKRLENDIKAKEQAIANNKRLVLFRNLLAVCAIIVAVIVFWNYGRTKALNKVLQNQNADIALQKEEISRQKEDLDMLKHTKDQLFSIISHDLRSPFAAIIQTMDMMKSGDLNIEDQGVLFESFYRQVSLVSLMVNNLLIWANSQQSGIKSNLLKLNIVEVVHELISVSGFLAKHKQINLYQRNDGGKWIVADLDHVKIIIQNLIGNAIKFTPVGGIVEIYYTEDEYYIAAHVRDNGVGIPAEKRDKLFKVTGKEISGYGTNNEGGAGIGLVIIKQFVDVNEGKIEITSEPGAGTDFAVYFKKASHDL